MVRKKSWNGKNGNENQNHSITTCCYESNITEFPCFVASTILSLSPITFLFCASKGTWASNGRTCRWFLSVTGYECELLNTNSLCECENIATVFWIHLRLNCAKGERNSAIWPPKGLFHHQNGLFKLGVITASVCLQVMTDSIKQICSFMWKKYIFASC